MNRNIFRGTTILLLASLAMGCQQSKRIEIETGPNVLQVQQAMQRERLEMEKQMQTQRIEAAAARQREFTEMQKARDAARRDNCFLTGTAARTFRC